MGRDLILLLVLIGAAVGYVLLQGHRVKTAEHRAQTAMAQAAQLQIQLDEARGNVRVVTRYVDRVQIVHERGATIIKEIPVYVTPAADARCTVPAGFVRVHDAAAQNLPIAGPAGDPDAPAAGVTLSGVADTITGNYTACHATTEQVIGLQDYVRSLQAARAQ